MMWPQLSHGGRHESNREGKERFCDQDTWEVKKLGIPHSQRASSKLFNAVLLETVEGCMAGGVKCLGIGQILGNPLPFLITLLNYHHAMR